MTDNSSYRGGSGAGAARRRVLRRALRASQDDARGGPDRREDPTSGVDIHPSSAATHPTGLPAAPPTRAGRLPRTGRLPRPGRLPRRQGGGYPPQQGYPDQRRLPRPTGQGGYAGLSSRVTQTSAATPSRDRAAIRSPMSSVLPRPAATAARATTRAYRQGGGYAPPGGGQPRRRSAGLRRLRARSGPPGRGRLRAPPEQRAGYPDQGGGYDQGYQQGGRDTAARTTAPGQEYTQYSEHGRVGATAVKPAATPEAASPRVRLRPAGGVRPATGIRSAGRLRPVRRLRATGRLRRLRPGRLRRRRNRGHPAARRRQRPHLPAARGLQRRGPRTGRPVPAARHRRVAASPGDPLGRTGRAAVGPQLHQRHHGEQRAGTGVAAGRRRRDPLGPLRRSSSAFTEAHRAQRCRASPRVDPPSKYRDVADVLGVTERQGCDARTERTPDAGTSTAADARRIS